MPVSTITRMTGTQGVRPTKKCLDDLGISPPALDEPLHRLEADPIPAAQSFPEVYDAGGLSRIVSIKDRVWFKLKTGRWRGAVTRLTDRDLAEQPCSCEPRADSQAHLTLLAANRWWLGAVGRREDGSGDDFYANLVTICTSTWSPATPDRIDSRRLLPQTWDHRRLQAEQTFAQVRIFENVMVEAAARSLRCGKVATAQFSRFSMGVVIRADGPEQFVAFIAEGVYDPKVLAVMMASLPGVDPGDWAPEPGGIADLQPGLGQVVWSAPLSTEAAAHILAMTPSADEDV